MSDTPAAGLEPMDSALLLEALNASNQARLDRVAAEGFPMNVLGCYVADLVDFLMPEGSPERLEFESRWEHHLSVLLDEAESMIRRARLSVAGAEEEATTMAARLVKRGQ